MSNKKVEQAGGGKWSMWACTRPRETGARQPDDLARLRQRR